MKTDVLDRFSPATAAWFRSNFVAPTPAQAGAWAAISEGRHTLVVAPTGSGKTLSAFLWALDRLAQATGTSPPGSVAGAGRAGAGAAGAVAGAGSAGASPPGSAAGAGSAGAGAANPGSPGTDGAGARRSNCRVLYVSPLKALAVDVERNLRSPLVGIGHAAARLGLPRPDIRVAVRSGDTPATERRLFAKDPADILITTPESLFLLLTSSAREALTGIETVIVDEIHAVAGTKRGAHLALSLERLDALLPAPAQRIGLSATVRPIEEVARFLAGGRPVTTVAPPSEKRWQLDVVVPVPDLGAIGEVTGDLSGPASGDPQRTSIWPHVEERIADLIEAHRSTLVFANSRRLAERLTARLNDIHAERVEAAEHGAPGEVVGAPGQGVGRSGEVVGAPGQEVGRSGEEEAAPGQEGARGEEPGRPREEGAPGQAVGRSGEEVGQPGHAKGQPHQAQRLPHEVQGGRLAPRTVRDGPSTIRDHVGLPPPAQVMAQAGQSYGAPPLLARAHHGSVSKEQRAATEEDLKAGRLPAVVATSSLELGIDMGAVDLVVQVEAPPSVGSGLQRVGRAGHQVGAVSHGVFFPKFRGDLVQTAVTVERMRAGQIEALRVPSNPLDVLAQQIVAMVALDDWSVGDLESLVRRSAPFAGLTRGVLESVLDMLSGRYPSDEFADLRPRLVWDRIAGTLSGRRGAQRLAVTSGGTIPDRGLFGVFIAGAEGPGRRVGELDEEMVYESRVGDVITLGTSAWRIEEITHDQVRVLPAPGKPARLPFWKGDTLGRPAELGKAVGAFVREVTGLALDQARRRVNAAGLDDWATDNLLAYLGEQREAVGHVPSDVTIVVERFRDELGDWRIVVHSPFGAPVHAPWALAIAARLREQHGLDVQAMHADDGLVFRLPDTEWGDDLGASGGRPPDVLQAILLEPDDVSPLVTEQIGGSALFASRFRECAGRALLLPRRRPDRRQALWQQRQRASQLLEVASQYPSFPIVLEAVRECVQDVFDVPSLTELMRDIAARKVRVVEVQTPAPSPFARSLMFGYVAQFLYEGDSPLAEKRAAALALDPGLLSELLGTGDGLELRDLLDPAAIDATEAELQHLADGRRARDAEDIADLVRTIGPIGSEAVAARVEESARGEVASWLVGLEATRRLIRVRIQDTDRWAAAEDAGRLRDALGCSLPVGLPEAFTAVTVDPLGDLVARYARCHGPFTLPEVASWLGLGPAVVREVLRRLVADGRVVEGRLRPPGTRVEADGAGPAHIEALDYCDARVLRVIRRRSLAALRAEVEPVPAADYARFLPAWHDVGGTLRGPEGVLAAVRQLAGYPLPASSLESVVLPARVQDYRPGLLEELISAGEVLWQGNGALSGTDGWVSLHPADSAHVTLRPAATIAPGSLASTVLDLLDSGGAFLFRRLSDLAGSSDDRALLAALWELAWAGHVTTDTLTPLRALLAGGRTAHKQRPVASRGRYAGRGRLGMSRAALPRVTGPPEAAGRWARLPEREPNPTVLAGAQAELLLDRYGVVTRGSVAAEDLPGGFHGAYRVLSAFEEAGQVRRGYFVEGLGAAQFADAGAIDRLRSGRAAAGIGEPNHVGTDHGVLAGQGGDDRPGRWPGTERREAAGTSGRGLPPGLVLAAADPANPYGAALPWPARPPTEEGTKGHQPGRKAGALVVLVAGELVLYVERGGRTLLSWTEEPALLSAAAAALAEAVHRGALGKLTVGKIDGELVLGSSHPLTDALAAAGFVLTPSGLRLRR